MKSRNVLVARDNWVGILIIEIYKCLGVMTTQFVYKKMYLVVVINARRRYDKRKKWVNTDNTPVPK